MCVYVPAHARVCVSSAVHNPIIDSVASSATKTHTHREGERARAHLALGVFSMAQVLHCMQTPITRQWKRGTEARCVCVYEKWTHNRRST